MIRFSRRAVTALAAGSLLGVITRPVRAAQDETPEAECIATTPEENAELARAYWREGVWGPQGKIATIVAPDEIHHWGIAGTTEGFEAFAERWALFNTAFPDLKFDLSLVTATDSMAATVWTATGTQEGEWMGIAPTGKTVSWTGINTFRIECGMIAESWGEADHIGLRAELGATDVPAMMADQHANATPVAGDAAAATACASGGADANEAAAVRWTTEVWNEQNLDTPDEIALPAILHHGASFPDAHGIDELKAALTRTFETFPDVSLTVEDVFSTDDTVVVRWAGTATQEGNFMGEAPTGASVTLSGLNVYRMACGQIVESWSEMNAYDVLNQIRNAELGEATPTA
ncbi:MAG: ester cyclase family protein [Thermomicrobiales bacterium]